MRARLALQTTGRECQLREVLLRDKPAHMLEISPKGTVPVLLLDNGELFEESLDIMLWTLGLSDPGAWLAPSHGSLSEMLELIERAEDDFKFHLDRYKYASRHEGAEAEAHRAQGALFLRGLEERLTRAPWLFGEHLALADAALSPFVRQFANTDRAWFDQQSWPHLRAYLEDFLASPIFASIMGKYPQWHEGEDAQRFPVSEEKRWTRSPLRPGD